MPTSSSESVPICCQRSEGDYPRDFQFQSVVTFVSAEDPHPRHTGEKHREDHPPPQPSQTGKTSPLDFLASVAFHENEGPSSFKWTITPSEGKERITVVAGPTGSPIRLHRGNGKLPPMDLSKPWAKKCRNRECNNIGGQSGKPRSIYCSKRCQSREQNLRQGRIKNVRSPTPTGQTSRKAGSPRSSPSPVSMMSSPSPSPINVPSPSPSSMLTSGPGSLQSLRVSMTPSPVPVSNYGSSFSPIPMSGTIPSSVVNSHMTPILLPRPSPQQHNGAFTTIVKPTPKVHPSPPMNHQIHHNHHNTSSSQSQSPVPQSSSPFNPSSSINAVAPSPTSLSQQQSKQQQQQQQQQQQRPFGQNESRESLTLAPILSRS